MPRLFVGNFDFEEHLAGDRQNPPEALQRINAELSPCLVSVAGEGDSIWLSAAASRTLPVNRTDR